MNTPVNFEIAKLLKEKEFDFVMKEHYTGTKLVISDIVRKYNWNKFTDMSGNSDYYSAPTISEVIMWLYEKHGIWVTVGADSLFHKGKHHILIYKNNGNGLELSPIEYTLHGPYDSPTEAYEAAIEYTLNNLI